MAPLTELSPEGIKSVAKELMKDRAEIKLTTRQNLIVEALGFEGKFADFKKAYDNELNPFMEQHGLKRRTDALTPHFHWATVLHLTPELLARAF